jgi:hypothetical protein
MKFLTARFSRNLWPHAIIAWFVIFAAAMAAWITVAVQQNLDLVRDDYYEEDVRFQRQLDRLNRSAALRGEVTVHHDATKGEVTLQLPAAHRSSAPGGTIQFYRPSNASLDFQLPLAIDADGRQRIRTESLRDGLWRMRVQWTVAGSEYYFEQIIVTDEASARLAASPTRMKSP